MLKVFINSKGKESRTIAEVSYCDGRYLANDGKRFIFVETSPPEASHRPAVSLSHRLFGRKVVYLDQNGTGESPLNKSKTLHVTLLPRG